ncbi:MAG: methyltransferase domain-containing protein [Cyclobacteriaceae bacterium]
MNKIKCLSCEESVNLVPGELYLTCPECEKQYPLISGSIPVFVTDAEAYLASTFLTIDHHIRSNNQLHEGLATTTSNTVSSERMQSVRSASEKNNHLFEGLIELIDPYITKRDVAAAVDSFTSSAYITGLDYLRRDWCWSDESEEEIGKMKSVLHKILETQECSGNALIMGGGMGRIAYELSGFFRNITVVDYSLTMGYLFNKVKNEDVEIFELVNKNLEESKNAVRQLTATISPLADDDNFDDSAGSKVAHYIADAKQTPFEDDSINVYFSIYFTDVLPLSTLISEVKRVLADGGYFIHFGPLDYHFDDPVEKYSGTELIDYLSTQGFTIVSSDTVTTNHCAIDHSLQRKVYRNLVYCFQLHKPQPTKLSGDEVLALRMGYIVKKEMGADDTLQTEIQFRNGETYEGAELISAILQEIDGEQTVSEIVRVFLSRELLTNDDKEKLFGILENFIDEGILKIIKKAQ